MHRFLAQMVYYPGNETRLMVVSKFLFSTPPLGLSKPPKIGRDYSIPTFEQLRRLCPLFSGAATRMQ
jgi:hypothetical protein